MGRTYVVDEAQTGSTRVDVASPEVAPAEVADESREDEATGDDEGAVPAVLPPDDLVPAQVADVGDTGLAAGLDEHPADMGPPETEMRVVRVERGVSVAMVRAVAASPPLDGALYGAGACDRQEIFERLGRVVGTVGPEAVVTRSDTCEC